MEAYAGQQFVGMDLHRKRSVLVRMTETGEPLQVSRISNDVERLHNVIALAGERPQVVLEATYGWYWAVDALRAAGAEVHLAHPLGVKAFEVRRVKNDVRDATDLADLLRMGRLPEAWIAPPPTRDLRALVRHRAKLVHIRTSFKDQVHAVLAGCGVAVPMTDLFGTAGTELLDRLALSAVPAERIASMRRLIAVLDVEIDTFAGQIHARLAADPAYAAVQTIPGVGRIFGAVFVAEIGDIDRFARPAQLASWAGLTPRHHESDTKVYRGRITKQGSRLVRWAAVESVKHLPATTRVGQYRERVAARRGRNIGAVAAARKQLEHVYWALREGHVDALDHPAITAAVSA